MQYKIIHLTHTDPRYDGRVLKQINTHRDFYKTPVLGMGILISEMAQKSNIVNDDVSFKIIKLVTKRLDFLPKFIRYFFNITELTFTMVRAGLNHKPLVIQCHDTMVLPAGWIIAKLLGSKLVYDAHELESQKGGQSRFLSSMTLFIENFCWSRINLLITVSEEIASWYNHNLGVKDSIVLYNTPNFLTDSSVGFVKYSEDYLRVRFDIPSNHLIFIYIGVIVKGRCIEYYIDLFKAYSSNASLVIMGYGYDEFYESIKESCNKYENIHLHEPVPHEDVVKVAKSADCGLCMLEKSSNSDYLALPNKFFEYANSGIPIIASNFPAMNRMILKYNVGKSTNPDKESIKQLINNIISQPELRRKYKPHFDLTWDGQLHKIFKAYNQLLK